MPGGFDSHPLPLFPFQAPVTMQARISTVSTGKPLAESTHQKALALFRDQGALWIERVFSPDFIDALREAYESRYLSLDLATLRRRFALVGDRRFMITVKIKPPFRSSALLASPVVMPIIRDLLGDDCTISSFGSGTPRYSRQPFRSAKCNTGC